MQVFAILVILPSGMVFSIIICKLQGTPKMKTFRAGKQKQNRPTGKQVPSESTITISRKIKEPCL